MISRQELLQLSSRHRMNLNPYNIHIEDDKITINDIEFWKDNFTNALENKLGRKLTCTYTSSNMLCSIGLLSVVLEKRSPSTVYMYVLLISKLIMTLVIPVFVITCYLYFTRQKFFAEFLLYKDLA